MTIARNKKTILFVGYARRYYASEQVSECVCRVAVAVAVAVLELMAFRNNPSAIGTAPLNRTTFIPTVRKSQYNKQRRLNIIKC